jgi:hypothetical protein
MNDEPFGNPEVQAATIIRMARLKEEQDKEFQEKSGLDGFSQL